MAATLPPWLAIDPIAPVGRYLQGYQIGASQGQAAAAQRRAEQATALSAQQQSEEMAFRREQAAQAAQIRQQEQALNAQKFALDLRTTQQKYEREAQEAARHLEGMQMYQKAIAAGEPQERALLQAAPLLLWRHPEKLADTIRELTPAQEPVPKTTPEGLPYLWNPRTGQPTFAPTSAQEFEPEVGTFGEDVIPGGVPMARTSRGQWRVIPKDQLTREEIERLKSIRAKQSPLRKALQGLTEEEIQSDTSFKTLQDQLDELEAEEEGIFKKGKTAEAPKGTEQAQAQRLVQTANQKIAEISSGIGIQRLTGGGVLTKEEAEKRVAGVRQRLEEALAKLGFSLQQTNAPAATAPSGSSAGGGLPYLWNPQTGEPNP